MNLMLLSAGLGTRLQPYTFETPKPAIPFLGVPLAVYSLSLFEKLKINNLVINTHHLPNKIEELFLNIKWPCKNLIFSNENVILGSGGGIRNALPHLIVEDNFIIANSDELIFPHSYGVIEEAVKFHEWHRNLATLITIKHPEVGTKFGGVWIKNGDIVGQFSKKPVAGHIGYHFIGIIIFNKRISEYFKTDNSVEENILYETLTSAIAQGEQVKIFNINAEWFESGNPADFINASKYCLEKLNSNDSSYWIDHLRQIRNLHGGQEDIIKF